MSGMTKYGSPPDLPGRVEHGTTFGWSSDAIASASNRNRASSAAGDHARSAPASPRPPASGPASNAR